MADQLTDEQVRGFYDAFNIFDKDENEKISAEELGTVMRTLGQNPTEDEVHAMIDEVDADGNGTIGFPEFLEMMAGQMNTIDKEEEIKEAFRVIDKDGSGFISRSEMSELFRSLGRLYTEEWIDDMIKAADLNSDGKFSYEEFVRLKE